MHCSGNQMLYHHRQRTALPVPSISKKSDLTWAFLVLEIHCHQGGKPWKEACLIRSYWWCIAHQCTESPGCTGCTGTAKVVTVVLEKEFELMSIDSKVQSENQCLAAGNWCALVKHLEKRKSWKWNKSLGNIVMPATWFFLMVWQLNI